MEKSPRRPHLHDPRLGHLGSGGVPPPPSPLSAGPPFPGTRDPGSPLSPAPPLGLPAPARNLGRSRAGASASGKDLCLRAGPPRAPGGARAPYEADHARCPSWHRASDPARGKKPGAGCLSRNFVSLSNCRLAGSEEDALRAAGSQGPDNAPGSAPSQAPRDPRGERAIRGRVGTAQARPLGEGSGEKSRGAGGRAVGAFDRAFTVKLLERGLASVRR